MHIQELDESGYSARILEILNHAIIHTTALFDYTPRSPEMMRNWFEAKRKDGYPVIGAVSDDNHLMGFASYGTFRAWPAYKYTVELSIYVHPDHRKKGVANALMDVLKQTAGNQGYHVLIGCIEARNQASINLHLKHGFTPAGVLHEVGFKFNQWLDVVFYQLILPSPSVPIKG